MLFVCLGMALNRDTFERVAAISARGEEANVHVEMSFLEIYNENVYDLLAAASTVRKICLFAIFKNLFSFDLVENLQLFGHILMTAVIKPR